MAGLDVVGAVVDDGSGPVVVVAFVLEGVGVDEVVVDDGGGTDDVVEARSPSVVVVSPLIVVGGAAPLTGPV